MFFNFDVFVCGAGLTLKAAGSGVVFDCRGNGRCCFACFSVVVRVCGGKFMGGHLFVLNSSRIILAWFGADNAACRPVSSAR